MAEMTKFKLDVSIEFEAEDLESAFDKLTGHFNALAMGAHSRFEFLGNIKIEPKEDIKNE
jgi:hypothetical protein